MNHPTRRADDHRPALPLRWGERFTLLLTGPNAGVIGAYGATWPGQPAEYERVNVCVEGAQKLDDIEQYRLQMAGISTAALGYWKEGDTIHPDYDTPALRDVARLYAKYDELFKFRESVRSVQAGDIPAGMSEAEYWKRYAAGEKACNDQLKRQIAELQKAMPAVALGERATPIQEGVWHAGYKSGYSDGLQDGKRTAEAGDAVDAAVHDAIVNGAGVFRVNGDGSTERVELTKEQHRHYAELAAFPPNLQRDALYQDYAAPVAEQPKQDGDK